MFSNKEKVFVCYPKKKKNEGFQNSQVLSPAVAMAAANASSVASKLSAAQNPIAKKLSDTYVKTSQQGIPFNGTFGPEGLRGQILPPNSDPINFESRYDINKPYIGMKFTDPKNGHSLIGELGNLETAVGLIGGMGVRVGQLDVNGNYVAEDISCRTTRNGFTCDIQRGKGNVNQQTGGQPQQPIIITPLAGGGGQPQPVITMQPVLRM